MLVNLVYMCLVYQVIQYDYSTVQVHVQFKNSEMHEFKTPKIKIQNSIENFLGSVNPVNMGICSSFDDNEEDGFLKITVVGMPESGKTALIQRLAWQATPKWILQNLKPTHGQELYPWRNEKYPGVAPHTNLLFHELGGTSLMSPKAKMAVCTETDLFLWCIDGTSSMCTSLAPSFAVVKAFLHLCTHKFDSRKSATISVVDVFESCNKFKEFFLDPVSEKWGMPIQCDICEDFPVLIVFTKRDHRDFSKGIKE